MFTAVQIDHHLNLITKFTQLLIIYPPNSNLNTSTSQTLKYSLQRHAKHKIFQHIPQVVTGSQWCIAYLEASLMKMPTSQQEEEKNKYTRHDCRSNPLQLHQQYGPIVVTTTRRLSWVGWQTDSRLTCNLDNVQNRHLYPDSRSRPFLHVSNLFDMVEE